MLLPFIDDPVAPLGLHIAYITRCSIYDVLLNCTFTFIDLISRSIDGGSAFSTAAKFGHALCKSYDTIATL